MQQIIIDFARAKYIPLVRVKKSDVIHNYHNKREIEISRTKIYEG